MGKLMTKARDADIDEALDLITSQVKYYGGSVTTAAITLEDGEKVRALLEELRTRRKQIRETIEGPKEPKKPRAWWDEPRHRIEGSSNLIAARYVSTTWDLEVVFKGGAVYAYADVPLAVWNAFKAAKSKGRFLNTMVKPTYPCEKLGG